MANSRAMAATSSMKEVRSSPGTISNRVASWLVEDSDDELTNSNLFDTYQIEPSRKASKTKVTAAANAAKSVGPTRCILHDIDEEDHDSVVDPSNMAGSTGGDHTTNTTMDFVANLAVGRSPMMLEKYETKTGVQTGMEILNWATGFTAPKDDGVMLFAERLQETTGIWSSSLGRSPLCFKIQASLAFKIGSVLLVLTNTIVIALRSDLALAELELEAPSSTSQLLEKSEYIFTPLFVLELLIRAPGSPEESLRQDWWLIIDSTVTSLGAIEVILRLVLDEGGNALKSLSSLRLVRFVKIMRLLRIVRVFRPLRLLAETLTAAFRDIFWILVVVCVVSTGAAAIFAASVGVLHVAGEYAILEEADDAVVVTFSAFNGWSAAVFTWNAVLLSGLRWGTSISRALFFSTDEFAYHISGLLVIGFVLFMLVCLVNLMYGTLVNTLLMASRNDSQLVDHMSLASGAVGVSSLRKTYLLIDTNKDGFLTWTEFRQGLKKYPDLCNTLQIEYDQAEALFDHLDGDGKGVVSVDDFMIGLIKLTRRQGGRTLDMVSLDFMQQKTLIDLERVHVQFGNDMRLMENFMSVCSRKILRLLHRTRKLANIANQDNFRQALQDAEGLNEDEVSGMSPPAEQKEGIVHETGRQQEWRLPIEGTDERVDTLMDYMQQRYAFRSRVKTLKAKLAAAKEAAAAAEPGANALSANGALTEAGAVGEGAGLEASCWGKAEPMIWCEVLAGEVIPFIREKLSTFHTARAKAQKSAGVRGSAARGSEVGRRSTSSWIISPSTLHLAAGPTPLSKEDPSSGPPGKALAPSTLFVVGNAPSWQNSPELLPSA